MFGRGKKIEVWVGMSLFLFATLYIVSRDSGHVVQTSHTETGTATLPSDTSTSSAEFDAMTDQQHYDAAASLLEVPTSGVVVEAQRHLHAINANSPYAHRAAVLWDGFKRRQRQQQMAEEQELKENNRIAIKQREAFAETVENQLLREWYEMEVQAIGPDKTTLHVYYALAGKAFAYHFADNNEVFKSARAAGFKKIELSNGDAVWTWTL